MCSSRPIGTQKLFWFHGTKSLSQRLASKIVSLNGGTEASAARLVSRRDARRPSSCQRGIQPHDRRRPAGRRRLQRDVASVSAAEDRASHRTRIALRPGSGIGCLKELRQVHVEEGRLFQIDVVAAVSHHNQRRGRHILLHQEWLEAGPVLVTGHDHVGTVTALVATEPEQSVRAEAATSREAALSRVLHAAIGAFSEFLGRKDAWAALVFVVLFKFTDAFSGTMTAPFVIDLGFTRNDYAAIVKGVGLAATLIGGFAGGFVARRYSLAASLWIGGVLQAVANLSFSWLALVGRQPMGVGVRNHGREFHQRDRYRDLCRLPLGAVPQSAAYRNPICAAHGACRSRSDLSFIGRGLCRKGGRLAAIFAICVLVAVPSLILLLGCSGAGISMSWGR